MLWLVTSLSTSFTSNKQSIDVKIGRYCLFHSLCTTVPLTISYLAVFSRTPLGPFLAFLTDGCEFESMFNPFSTS